MRRAGTAAAFAAVCAAGVAAQVSTTSSPGSFDAIAPLVDAAIARQELPGAVILVGRGDRVLFHQAYGRRAVAPAPETMTEDTVFDLASLTKVVATTTSVMQLVEQGRIRLHDPVAQFIPEFAAHGKERVTILHLLTHTSGLPPDLPLDVEFHGADEAIRRASDLAPAAVPGERFVYSDINFFLLGDIVRRVSGERLDRYAKTHVFDPLRMTETTFLPPEAMRARIAPTERCRPLAWPCTDPAAPFLRGIVHDPTARRMDGVAGHAGLFSTAADLSRFCRMLLNGGVLDGARILAPATVERMITPSTPAGMKDVRGLGWDIDSAYSSNRGDLFPFGSFGHTGFTGTSLWLDPASGGYVVFLSNRVHPDGKGDVTPLRGKVATIAAAALSERDASADRGLNGARGVVDGARGLVDGARGFSRAMTGIDVLEADGFHELQGKRVGLLTNQTGKDRAGRSTIDVLAHAPGVTLAALFSPEHGIRGVLDEKVPSSRDEATGLPIHSLYGDTRRPSEAMLSGLDAVVIDLQDIGARFYTYPATVAYTMEEAAKRGIAIVVLDRPNPIGAAIEGPMQDASAVGFTGYLPMPIRHGMTIGELAKLFNGARKMGAALTVVPMRNWRRTDWFDETGLTWTNPSPNMRTMNAAALYPGIGAIEGTNISVGRGTDTPFEQIGAPWIDGARLAAELDARAITGAP
ncbi:MAG TPA: exo-beta-N-acetylmuramidase NamZ domain-containing protein, partial [Vicinamibacterales bacterium]|nr:exo-beta-N-acetylmuramidase NamZ domain-containing protein [Vicinamibacterales bacterium]